MTTPEKTRKEKPIDTAASGEQLEGRIIAIGNADETPTVLIETDAVMRWVSFGQKGFKTLLAGLGPDPLDGRRKVLIRVSENEGSTIMAADVFVYAGAVL